VERPFYIVSELGSGRYLTTINGGRLAIKTKNGNSQQTWFFDQKSLTVKNMQNKKSLHINGNGGAKTINVYNTNSQWYQIFKYEGQHICNFQNHKCLDVEGKNDKEGNWVNVEKRADASNQQWKIVFLDKAKPDPTEGLNKEFGFHINRPFYIVSRLWMRRVVECHGANNLALNRYNKGKIGQQFFFDQKTKTVRSQLWKNYSMEIQGNGGSSNLRMTSGINSRWW
jgi:hypothetical protein